MELKRIQGPTRGEEIAFAESSWINLWLAVVYVGPTTRRFSNGPKSLAFRLDNVGEIGSTIKWPVFACLVTFENVG